MITNACKQIAPKFSANQLLNSNTALSLEKLKDYPILINTFQMVFNIVVSTGIILFVLTMVARSANAQITDPNSLNGLVFWVDAQDVNGTGVQPANGTIITQWVDKSGSGINLSTIAGTVTFESAGLDGVNPSLHFPLVARMAATNPFTSSYQNEMTVFLVNANVTLTNNFALSLNGTNTGSSIADGRFSFHTPWSNNVIYFDSGACCGSTRLEGANPNAFDETTLYTGLNDQTGNRQWLRIDGAAFRDDTNGHNANVSRGVHLGDMPDAHRYNGRFAEVVIYNRALSLTEVQDVECYLLAKWKPSAAPFGCLPTLTVSKTSEAWDTLGFGLFRIPGNDVRYEVTASKPPSAALNGDSLFIVDSLPPNVTFYNGDVDDEGSELHPVGFSESGTGLTFNYASDVAFSNVATAPVDFAACTYVPTVGYDANVRHICIKPKGIMIGSSTITSLTIFFRARVN